MSGTLKIPKDKLYIGYDVVESLRRPNETNRKFVIYKNIHDFNETGDLLLAKQVIQHWPSREIEFFMTNIIQKFKYALITNDYTEDPNYPDINYGQYRPINLDKYKPRKEVMLFG